MGNKSSNIKERILFFAENQEVSKQVFFKKIGMTHGNFTGKAKETPINSNAIEKILLNYPQINLHWLITGIGHFLKADSTIEDKPIVNDSSVDEMRELLDLRKELIETQKDQLNILKNEIIRLKGMIGEDGSEHSQTA